MMLRSGMAVIALGSLCACGASVSASRDDGAVRADATVRDGTVIGVDRVTPPMDGTIAPPFDAGTGIDVPITPRPDVVTGVDRVVVPPTDVVGNARGEWRLTTFRFSLMGSPTQITDTNRSLPSDPRGRWRVNGTLDVRDDRIAYTWAVLRDDHSFVSDPSVDIDEGYSANGFYWNGTLDDRNQRFIVGAVSLDFSFESTNVIQLRSERDGWSAIFTREPRVATPPMPGLTLEGQAAQVSASTSDPFVRPRVGLLWDMPGGARVAETSSSDLAFSGGGVLATYRMALPSIAPGAEAVVNGVRLAVAHIVVYDDVDRNGRFDSAMAGGTGPDIPRGVSPIGVAVHLGGTPDPMFDSTPFRLLKPGWQFVNVERNSDPRPAVLVPYAMANPIRPDVPVSETRVPRRILDLVP